MIKEKRKDSRFIVNHIKYICLNIIGKNYPLIDLTINGLSIVDEIKGSGLKEGLKIKNMKLRLGSEMATIDLEVLSANHDQGIFGLKIVKFHGKAQKNIEAFVECMENASQRNDFSFKRLTKESWRITTEKLIIKMSKKIFMIEKKPMLMNERRAKFLTIAYLSGLNPDEYPVETMIEQVLRTI